MSAPTNEDLGIVQDERDALLLVRDHLRDATIPYAAMVERDEIPAEILALHPQTAFTMTVCTFVDRGVCLACIAGLVALVLQGITLSAAGERITEEQALLAQTYFEERVLIGREVNRETPVVRLFMPPSHLDWALIRPQHAADAIDRLIDEGDPGWPATDPAPTV